MDKELTAFLEVQFAQWRADSAKMETRLTGEMLNAENRLVEKIHDAETRLLSEFWKWGRSSDQRVRRVEQSDATTVERLAAMEDRLHARTQSRGQ